MTDTLLNHRSIRKYTGDPIPSPILDYILEAGTRASTTGNMQVYSIIVSTEEEVKNALSPCHFNQAMVKEAPVVLTFCADFNRFNHWCRLNKAEPGYDNFLSFFTAAIDALLVAQNVCIAAEDAGLGICYLGTTTYMAGKIIRGPGSSQGSSARCHGNSWLPRRNARTNDRLPLEAVVHREKYHDYSDSDIQEPLPGKGIDANLSRVYQREQQRNPGSGFYRYSL